jgi:hypothetical protein
MTPSRHFSGIGNVTWSSSTLLPALTTSSWALKVMLPSSTNCLSSPPVSRNVELPMLTRSCSVSTCLVTRWPLTNVPLWLPRSMISYWPVGDLRSSAWCRDTLRSDRTTSLSGIRPMRMALAGSGIRAVGLRSTLGSISAWTAAAGWAGTAGGGAAGRGATAGWDGW